MSIMRKRFFLPLFFIIFSVVGYSFYTYFTACDAIIFKSSFVCNLAKPKVLVLYMHKGFSGSQVAALKHYKVLLNAGYPVSLMVAKGSYSDNELNDLKLSHYSCRFFKKLSKNYSYFFGWQKNLRKICIDEKIDIIHCNHDYEVFGARQAVMDLPIKVLATRH